MHKSVLVFLLIAILPILLKFVVSYTLIKNTKQSGKAIKIIQPSGIKMCAKYCFSELRCQSFNFEQETLSCEVLSTEGPSLYMRKKGYHHGNIRNWSNDLAGKCGNNHCSAQERCVPLTYGETTCIKIGCVGIRYTYDSDTGLCYHVYQEMKTWTKASEHCQDEGGRLIVLDTQAKLNYFPPSNYKNDFIAIGLTDSETEGIFKWVTGSNLTHHKFPKNQPNDADVLYPGMSANCVSSRGKFWFDNNCERKQKYACERPDLSVK